MEGKFQNRLHEVSADEIGRLIQAVARYCGISPTGSNTTTGQIRRIDAVLEEVRQGIQVGRNMSRGTSLPTWTSWRACLRKNSKIWPKRKDALASIGRMKIGRPLTNSWRSHSQDAGQLPAASADQPRSRSGSHFLKVQNDHWNSELDCGGAGMMAKHPCDEKEALNY